MSRTTDIVVVGSGMAGLAAALAAASQCRVRVISEGMGALGISGGALDLLGYDNTGKLLEDPWEGMALLDQNHPYSLAGEKNVREALDAVIASIEKGGLKLQQAKKPDGKPRNFRIPTIMGTLKPTYYFQDGFDPELIDRSRNILVISVKGFRDCKPALIINQLRRYPGWADKDYQPLVLPQPYNEKGRGLNALDLAQLADREKGAEWLLNEIQGRGKNFDLALIPPFLGARSNSTIRQKFPQALGCPALELISIPPGVGGLRIRDALIRQLRSMGVEFFENAIVSRGERQNDECSGLVVNAAGREVNHKAKAFVIATGGIFNGGTLLSPGAAREAIFGLEIPVPKNVEDWSEPEIFGQHLFTRLGVKVNSGLQACSDDGSALIKNVFFAGRTLGGYDYASEKSGFGVAAATGWLAGNRAAELVASRSAENNAQGGDK